MAKKLLFVRVGNDIRPATQVDIDEVEAKLKPLFKDDEDVDVVVTHHAVAVDVIDLGDWD